MAVRKGEPHLSGQPFIEGVPLPARLRLAPPQRVKQSVAHDFSLAHTAVGQKAQGLPGPWLMCADVGPTARTQVAVAAAVFTAIHALIGGVDHLAPAEVAGGRVGIDCARAPLRLPGLFIPVSFV